jgi:hypothetical protein
MPICTFQNMCDTVLILYIRPGAKPKSGQQHADRVGILDGPSHR